VSVCLLGTYVSPAKTAELIQMPIGVWTLVGPRNHVLDGGPDTPKGMGNFGGIVRPIDKHCESLLRGMQQNNQSRHRRDCCSRLYCLWLAGVTL